MALELILLNLFQLLSVRYLLKVKSIITLPFFGLSGMYWWCCNNGCTVDNYETCETIDNTYSFVIVVMLGYSYKLINTFWMLHNDILFYASQKETKLQTPEAQNNIK